MTHPLQSIIDQAWEDRASLTPASTGAVADAVNEVLGALDAGQLRVAEPTAQGWIIHQWIKKAVLLSFRLTANHLIAGGAGASHWYDKVDSKFSGWDQARFAGAGFRAVPGVFVRKGAYVAKDAILMPSFINIGAHIGAGTMVDSLVTIGSCAQIGQQVHVSSGVTIGGVLEPLQANPVIIEDHCFIGTGSTVTEGVYVQQGAVLGSGVHLNGSSKIIDRDNGVIHVGTVPPFAVVVPGSMPGKPLPDGTQGPSLNCAVIVKKVDAQTRSKTSINDLLRD